jgi:hypothetical protein
MHQLALQRIASTAVIAALDVGLWRFVAPRRSQLVAALTAGAVVGVLDVLGEAVFGLLGVWRYQLSFSVAGIPVELVVDIGLVAVAIALGVAAVERRYETRRSLVVYVLCVSFALGTWAVFENTHAVRQGIIVFAKAIDVGSAWFVAGNYASIFFLVAGVTSIYRYVERKRA